MTGGRDAEFPCGAINASERPLGNTSSPAAPTAPPTGARKASTMICRASVSPLPTTGWSLTTNVPPSPVVISPNTPPTCPPGAFTVTAPPLICTSIGVLEVSSTVLPERIVLVTGPGAETATGPPASITLETPPDVETTLAAPVVDTAALTGPAALTATAPPAVIDPVTAPCVAVTCTPCPAVTWLDTPEAELIFALLSVRTVALTGPLALTATGPVARIDPVTGPAALTFTVPPEFTWLLTAPWLDVRFTPPPAVTLLETPVTDAILA